MTQSVEGLKAAADTTKQIITLSTGVAGLTVTFAKEFKTGPDSLSVPVALQVSWVLLLLAIVAAIWTLMAITGSLSKVDQRIPAEHGMNYLDVNSINIKRPAILMIVLFLAGLITTGIAGSSIVH